MPVDDLPSVILAPEDCRTPEYDWRYLFASSDLRLVTLDLNDVREFSRDALDTRSNPTTPPSL